MLVHEKPLQALDQEEWESLCDGCGRCCLIKFEDEDTGKYFYTNVVCEQWDEDSGQCKVYDKRARVVPDCLNLKKEKNLSFLPNSCAYRLRSQGKALPQWHPLISGDPATVDEAGVTIKGKVVSEAFVHPRQFMEHIIEWIEVD